jgi:hypothetical protein
MPRHPSLLLARKLDPSMDIRLADAAALPLDDWVVPNAATGTGISISALRRAKALDLEKLRGSLAERFYPAIASGRRIFLNGEAVPLLAEPPMTDIIDRELALSDGRSAHVRVGLLNEDARLYRVHISYRQSRLRGANSHAVSRRARRVV